MNVFKKIIALALLVAMQAPAWAQAATIAVLLREVPRSDLMLVVEVRTMRIPPESCGGIAQGASIQVFTTTHRIFPRMTPYAQGCWRDNGANIEAIMRHFQSGEMMHVFIDKNDLDTTGAFRGWDISRY